MLTITEVLALANNHPGVIFLGPQPQEGDAFNHIILKNIDELGLHYALANPGAKFHLAPQETLDAFREKVGERPGWTIVTIYDNGFNDVTRGFLISNDITPVNGFPAEPVEPEDLFAEDPIPEPTTPPEVELIPVPEYSEPTLTIEEPLTSADVMNEKSAWQVSEELDRIGYDIYSKPHALVKLTPDHVLMILNSLQDRSLANYRSDELVEFTALTHMFERINQMQAAEHQRRITVAPSEDDYDPFADEK